MFQPNAVIIRFPSERVSIFVRSMRLCNDCEISSSVGFIITIIETLAGEGVCDVGIVLTWVVVLRLVSTHCFKKHASYIMYCEQDIQDLCVSRNETYITRALLKDTGLSQ